MINYDTQSKKFIRKKVEERRSELDKVPSPVAKYKNAKSYEKRSVFHFKEAISSHKDIDKKVQHQFAMLKGSNAVIERLRISQKMAEQRDIKFKKIIDAKRELNVDDGDHGVSKGMHVKRKGFD